MIFTLVPSPFFSVRKGMLQISNPSKNLRQPIQKWKGGQIG
jgi:hypothetical protein